MGKGKLKKRETHARREDEAKKEKSRKKAYIEKFLRDFGGGEARGGRRGKENLTKIRIFENLKAEFAKFSQIVK